VNLAAKVGTLAAARLFSVTPDRTVQLGCRQPEQRLATRQGIDARRNLGTERGSLNLRDGRRAEGSRIAQRKVITDSYRITINAVVLFRLNAPAPNGEASTQYPARIVRGWHYPLSVPGPCSAVLGIRSRRLHHRHLPLTSSPKVNRHPKRPQDHV
jgi:hypothetical protein